MDRRKFITGAITFATAIGLAPRFVFGQESASAYPTKPIRLIVPYAAGGGTDLLARTWAQVLTTELGQSVIVENMSGVNGVIGTSFAAKAAPDGYTLYIATYGFPVTPLLMANPQYAVSDFAPIIRTGSSPLVLVVSADSPIKSVQDLIAAARAKPGALNVGTLGDGSQEQMGAQKFQSIAGVKFTEIPYKGGAPAITDLMSNNIQLVFEGLPTVMGYIKAGRLRAIGVAGLTRSSQLPDVPTLDEQGVKGMEVYSWTAFLVPARTPRPIINKLNAAFRKGLADPAISGKLAQSFGSDPIGGSPEDLAEFLAARTRENVDLIKSLGIRPQ